MGITSGRKLLRILENLESCLAIEFLCRGKAVIAPDAEGVRELFNDEEVVFFESESPVGRTTV